MRSALLLLTLFATVYPVFSQPAAKISGKVTSLNGSLLPKAHLLIEPWNTDLLLDSKVIEVEEDGKFEFSIAHAGLYRVKVRGVLHKRMQFPLWIREPESREITIRLDPKNLDDGTYFDNDEYLSWIRLTGNFNGYNYDSGIRFKREGPNTLTANINIGLDTLRYQIIGLTTGTVVLPGADDYILRDPNNYEALVAVTDNSVTLTYHADSTYYPTQNPYEGYRTTWDPNQSEYHFTSPSENKIQYNLNQTSYFAELFDYRVVSSDSLPVDEFQEIVAEIYNEGAQLRIKELKKVEQKLKNRSHSEAYQQSLFIKYLRLSRYLLYTEQRQLEANGVETRYQKHINADVLNASMEGLPASSPLWSLERGLPNVYTDVLGYTTSVISFLELLSKENPDNKVSGPVLLKLFKRSYDIEGNSQKTKAYYQQILDRFGNRYYAQKAREYVQKNE